MRVITRRGLNTLLLSVVGFAALGAALMTTGLASSLALVAPSPAIPTPLPNPPLRTQVPPNATTPEVLPPQIPVALPPPSATTAPIDDASIKLWYDAGVALRADADPGRDDIIARVDSLGIKRREVSYLQALALGSNRGSPNAVAADRHSLVMSKVRALALGAEATRRGLTPTPAEVDARITLLRAQLHSLPQSALELGAFLSGLGQTEDDYFSSADVRSSYARELAVTKMKTLEVASVGVEAREEAWQRAADRVAAVAAVVILDPAYR